MNVFYDLHLHSCLSPCAEPDMTPHNIVGMAALCGFQVIAVSDHNSCRQCPAVLHAAKEQGILAIPAMELTTSEEAHVLCLLPDLVSALAFSDYVYERIPNIPNRTDIFGDQVLVDEEDNPVDTEPKLLISATSISVYDTVALLREYGGAAVPAHIDRSSFSVLSNLGLWDNAMGFSAYEVFDLQQLADLHTRFPDLTSLHCLSNSDAHRLDSMRDASQTLKLDRLSAKAVIEALL